MQQLFEDFDVSDHVYVSSSDCVNRYTKAAVEYVRMHPEMTFLSYELGCNMLAIRFKCVSVASELVALFYTNIRCGDTWDPSFITVEIYKTFKCSMLAKGIRMVRYEPRTSYTGFKWFGHLFKPECPITGTPYMKQKDQ